MERKYSLHSVAEDSGCICSCIIIMHLIIAQAGRFIHYQPSLKAGLFSTCMFQDDEVFLKDRKTPPTSLYWQRARSRRQFKEFFNTSQFSATGHFLVTAKLHPTVVTTGRLSPLVASTTVPLLRFLSTYRTHAKICVLFLVPLFLGKVL